MENRSVVPRNWVCFCESTALTTTESFPFLSESEKSVLFTLNLLVEIVFQVDSFPLHRVLVTTLDKLCNVSEQVLDTLKGQFLLSLSHFLAQLPESREDYHLHILETLVQLSSVWFDASLLNKHCANIIQFFACKLLQVEEEKKKNPYLERREHFEEILAAMSLVVPRLPLADLLKSHVRHMHIFFLTLKG